MSVTIEMPRDMEDRLVAEWGNLSQAAKEALAIESYRTGKISVEFFAKMLGMGVLDADEWLARRGVPLSYSADDLDADRKTLGELFNVKR